MRRRRKTRRIKKRRRRKTRPARAGTEVRAGIVTAEKAVVGIVTETGTRRTGPEIAIEEIGTNLEIGEIRIETENAVPARIETENAAVAEGGEAVAEVGKKVAAEVGEKAVAEVGKRAKAEIGVPLGRTETEIKTGKGKKTRTRTESGAGATIVLQFPLSPCQIVMVTSR